MATKTYRELVDGDTFTVDGVTHVCAVNMAVMGSVSCYSRPEARRTAASLCYRVGVADPDAVVVVAGA